MSQIPDEEVVISGIGGFFPRSAHVEEFAQLLIDNVHAVDPARWKAGQLDVCDLTSNVPDIESFDASYFGIHRQQVTYMDPMQRLALECTVQAVLDAGLNPTELRGRRVGVYMASCISENDSLMFESVENGFGVTGQARAMMANRISYWLNATGPSCSFDSSWTGGAQVLHAALNAVRSGQCEAAVAGATNLALNIYPHWLFKQLGLTAPDGVTRPLDSDAGGYSRGESIVVLLIQRARSARRSYAQLVHADVQYDGTRPGPLRSLDTTGLAHFLRDFYREAGVNPAHLEYLELYSAGIKEIDEVEMSAVEKVMCCGRSDPLPVGSVKSNVGHTEAAAALIGVVKVLLAMESLTIPATLHHHHPNVAIRSLLNGRCEVVTQNRPWNGELAAVNCIGLSSSYGHVLLRSRTQPRTYPPHGLPLLTLLSARSEETMKEVTGTALKSKVDDADYQRLVHDVFSTNIPGHLYRGFLVRGATEKEECQHYPGGRRPVWLVYSGMGSQWRGMARDLLRLPIFTAAVHRCHETLRPMGLDLLGILTSNEQTVFDNILHSFVGIAAVQIGLTDVLRSVGVTYDGLIGHSVGELGCAYADGCLSAEQMILSAYYRGKASQDVELVMGMMAAVGLSSTSVRPLLPPEVDVACHNGPDSCTLSGPAEPMRLLVAHLQSSGVFAKLVNVSNIAYHSRYIRPAAPLLLEYLRGVISEPRERSSRWLSTSVPEAEWGSARAHHCSAEYLTNNLLSPVLFEEASRHIPAGALVVEVAPHGLLQAILRRSLPSACIHIPLTRRADEHNLEFMLTALGKMYLSGLDLNVAALYPPVEYPVGRGTASLAPLVRCTGNEKWRTGLEEFRDYSYSERTFVASLDAEEFRDVRTHCIRGRPTVPLATFLTLACNILNNTKQFENVVFDNIIIERHIEFTKTQETVPLAVMVQRGSGIFEASDTCGVLLRGRLSVPEVFARELVRAPDVRSSAVQNIIDGEHFYRELDRRGYQYNETYRTVRLIQFGAEGCVARILWKQHWRYMLTAMLQLHFFHTGQSTQNLLTPVTIRRINLSFENLPENDQEYEVHYHYLSETLTCPTIQLVGVHSEPQLPEPQDVTFEGLRFVPSSGANIQDAQLGMDVCMRVFLENAPRTRDHLRVVEVCSSAGTSGGLAAQCMALVRRSFERYPNRQIRMDSVDDETSAVVAELVVVTGSKADDALEFLRRGADCVLACRTAYSAATEPSYPLSIAASFEHSGVQYCLIKLAADVRPLVVDLSAKMVDVSNLSNLVPQLLNDIQPQVKEAHHDSRIRIYLFSNSMPAQGIDAFVDEVRTALKVENIRFVFALDEEVPTCSLKEPFYQQIFQRDLVVNILQNGCWGQFINEAHAFTLHERRPANHALSLETFSIDRNSEIQLSCVGVCLAARTGSDKRDALRHVDYAGVKGSGQRVMGMASVELHDLRIIPDTELTWTVPDDWSDADAASVPYAYTMAYYVLEELARLKAGETILVHDGCSSVGQAVMSVAHSRGAQVFTTARSCAQRAFLRARLPQLKDHHILEHEGSDLDRQLIEVTCGEGTRVVVSCASGPGLFAAARCVAQGGCLIQLGVTSDDRHASFGMSMFLTCDALYGVDPSGLLEKSVDMRRHLRALLQRGIEEGVVKPIERRLFHHIPIHHVLRYLQSPSAKGVAVISLKHSKTKLQPPKLDEKEFVLSSGEMHVLYGDELATCLSTLDWMVCRGARHVTLSVSSGKTNSEVDASNNRMERYVQRQLSLLKHYHNADVSLYNACVNPVQALERALQSVRPVGTVIILHSGATEGATRIQLTRRLDASLVASGCGARLICLWAHDTNNDKCYRRLRRSLPHNNICWQNQYQLEDVLDFTTRVVHVHQDVTLLNKKVRVQEKEISHIDFALMLPRSIEVVRALGKRAPSGGPTLERVATATAYSVRELPPLIIVPAVGGERCAAFRTFLRKLICPAWLVNLGADLMGDVQQTAGKITQMLLAEVASSAGGHGFPQCYNIMGVSWGGALALEMTRALENLGHHAQLFLVDGAPHTMQAVLRHQGTAERLQSSLLAELLKLTAQEDLRGLETSTSWEERIDKAMLATGLQLPERTCQLADIRRGLILLEHRLRWLMSYQCACVPLHAHTHVIRPSECSRDSTATLVELCKNMKVKIVEGNHCSMLQDPDLEEYINESLKCSQ